MSDLDALTYRVRESATQPEGALVLLHGRGADEFDLFPLLDFIDPDRRFVGACPRGPLALPPGGAHWYQVVKVGYPDPDTFHPSYQVLQSWLDAFLAEVGVGLDRAILGGFSQGCVMSYALSLGAGRRRPAGMIGMSGFLPTVDDFAWDLDGLRGWPLAIGHGTFDPVIGAGWGRQARQRLEAVGASVLYRESPMEHTIDPRFLSEVRAWLAELL